MNPSCPRCKGDGWVCEAHPFTPQQDGKGCCGGPAIPCELCKPEGAKPLGFVDVATVETNSPMTPSVDLEFSIKSIRLDQLLEKGDENLTEAEGEELEALAHVLVDTRYRAHRIALVSAVVPEKKTN